MTEAEMQSAVTDALDWARWLWHHETDSRRSRPGYPDLHAVQARTQRVLHVELKTARGRTSREQKMWLTGLFACHRSNPRALVGVLRPQHLDETLRWIASRDPDAALPALPVC